MRTVGWLATAAAVATIVAALLTVQEYFNKKEPTITVHRPIQSPTIIGNNRNDINIIYGEMFDELIDVEIRSTSLVAYDAKGNQWRKKFNTKIDQKLIVDINDDGKRDVLIGFNATGPEHSTIIAFGTKGRQLWTYTKKATYPYNAPNSGKMRVGDLKAFLVTDKKIVSAIFADGTWFQSVWIILDKFGNVLKELWHPGALGEVKLLGDVFIVRGLNNDLRSTKISRYPQKNFSVLFALKYENIYGQAPPYFGDMIKNDDFEWYYALSDQKIAITDMQIVKGKVRIWTNCGKGYYFDEKGFTGRIGSGDDQSCPKGFGLYRIVAKTK